MNTVRIRHLVAFLTASAAVNLLVLAAATPAIAATTRVPHYGSSVPSPQIPAQIHTVMPGGMPGWQISLIAIGAALLGAALATVFDRTVTSRKHATPTLA